MDLVEAKEGIDKKAGAHAGELADHRRVGERIFATQHHNTHVGLVRIAPFRLP